MFRESCLNDSSCLQLFWQLIAGSCRWNIAFLASRRLVFHSPLLIPFIQLFGCSFVRTYFCSSFLLSRKFFSSLNLELAIKNENDEGFNDRSIVLDTGTYRKVSRSMISLPWSRFSFSSIFTVQEIDISFARHSTVVRSSLCSSILRRIRPQKFFKRSATR